MSRPARNRLFAVIFVVATLGFAPKLPSPLLWSAAALVFSLTAFALWLTTGFRRARALLAQKQYDAAATELAAFELSLTESWKRHVAGLAVGTYTTSAFAAARNTLGAVRLEQGRLDDAATHFSAAIALDAQYAVPWANRAVLAAMRGDAAGAHEAKDTAKKLGFRSKVLDSVVADKLAK